jgi:signal transduction histidine kinase
MNAKQLRSSDHPGADAGQIELHWGVFPCGDVVQEIVDILRPLASEKAQNIENAVEPALLVRADRAIRAHAIMNIFDKAIKYSPLFCEGVCKARRDQC